MSQKPVPVDGKMMCEKARVYENYCEEVEKTKDFKASEERLTSYA